MKKWLLALCSLAIIVPVSYADDPGDGGGDGDGAGMHQGGMGPGPGFGLELSPEILVLKDELQVAKDDLKASRDALLESLDTEATDEEIRSALEAWHIDNAVAIAEARAIAEEIRTWVMDNRPERPGHGPIIKARMEQRRESFRTNQAEVNGLRQQLRNQDLSEGDREQLRTQLRDTLRDRKHLMRNKRADEGGVGGDRRPGG